MAKDKVKEYVPDPTEFGIITSTMTVYAGYDSSGSPRKVVLGYIKPDAPNASLRAAAHGLASLIDGGYVRYCEKSSVEALEFID